MKRQLSLRLTWSQIVEMFDGEWVELVDFNWDWKDAHPRLATVRHHAPDRRALMESVRNAPTDQVTAILYISSNRLAAPRLLEPRAAHAA